MRETQGSAGSWLSRTYRPFGALLAAFCAVCALGTGCLTTVSSEPEVDPIAKAASVRNVGLDYVRQGNYAMAIRTLQDAQRQNPSDPLTYYGLGEAFRSKGLLPEAEANLLLSLENSPSPQATDYQTATLTLAAVYIQMERYPEAEVLCQILIDDPTYARPWVALTNRGWAQYKSGQFGEARSSYEEALDFRSDYAVAHFNLGILDQEQGRWLDSIHQLDLVTDSNQMSLAAQAEAHFRIGEIYMTLGRRDKAVLHFKAANEKAPESESGAKSHSYLELLL
jgi:tetratricopeptide (TPR) repeat protein